MFFGKTTPPMDSELFFTWKISTLSQSCEGNVHKLIQTRMCASVHTLSPISTQESSRDC